MIYINKSADYSGCGIGKVIVISQEVEQIAAFYNNMTETDKANLQVFFDSLGTIKNKLTHLFLPLFSSNAEDCLYNCISKAKVYPKTGNSDYITFNQNTKTAYNNATSYSQVIFENAAGDNPTLIVSGVSGRISLGSKNTAYTTINNVPYHKIVFLSYIDENNRYIGNDTQYSSTSFSISTKSVYFFGNINTEGEGHRILALGDGLTLDEVLILRDAIIAFDNKYFD